MTSHTPGPWVADESEDADGFLTIRRSDGTPNGDLETCIASVYGDEDAALIAAAPELLEALREAFGWLEAQPLMDSMIEKGCPEVIKLFHDCSAAIAKAEADPGRAFEENLSLQFGAQKLEGDL